MKLALFFIFSLTQSLSLWNSWDSCGYTYEPVCGSNGITYNNSCLCEQAHVTVAYVGTCSTSYSYNLGNYYDYGLNNCYGYSCGYDHGYTYDLGYHGYNWGWGYNDCCTGCLC